MPAVTDLDVKAPRRPSWNADDHPRDRRGRFIEIGAYVQLWGGARGTVMANAGGGRIEVAREGDGKRFLVGRARITVLERPDGGEPTEDADAADAAPVTPAAVEAVANPDDPDDDAAPAVGDVGPDWTTMRAQDFDTAVPLSLFDADDARPTSVAAAPAPATEDGQLDLFADLFAEPDPTAGDVTEDAGKAAASTEPEREPEHDHQAEPDVEPTYETPDMVFTMRAERLEEAVRRIDAANKRAEKAGIPGRIGYTVEHETRKRQPRLGEFGPEGVETYEDYVKVTLDVPTLKHEGYTFVATLAWDEQAGLIVRSVPGQPMVRRPEARKCDVCNSVRDRKDTYVIREDATGVEHQVGSNCLRQFMGIRPAGLWLLTFDADDFDDLKEGDDEDSGGGDERERDAVYGTDTVLRVAIAVARDRGWVSRERASIAGGLSTSDQVREVLGGKSKDEEGRRWKQRMLVEAQALEEEAREVRDLARTLEGDSEYVLNLRALASADRVTSRNLALLVSAVSAKMRRDEQRAEAEAMGNSQHIGKEKDKIKDVKARVTGVRHVESDYGTKTLLTFVTADGNVVKWWASKVINEHRIGDNVTIAGTIKGHGEFRGVKETTILRAKIAVAPETQAKRDAENAVRTTEVPDGMVEATAADTAMLGVGTVVRWTDRYDYDLAADVYATGTITDGDARDVEVELTPGGERQAFRRDRIVAFDPTTRTEWTPEVIDPERLVKVPDGFVRETNPNMAARGQQVRVRDGFDTTDDGDLFYRTATIASIEPGLVLYTDGSSSGPRITALGPPPPPDMDAGPDVRNPVGFVNVDGNNFRPDAVTPRNMTLQVGQLVRVLVTAGGRGKSPQYGNAFVVSLSPLTVSVMGDPEPREIIPGHVVGYHVTPAGQQAGRKASAVVLSVKKLGRVGGSTNFDEEKHPRDRMGRFIDIGAQVSVWGGGKGTVASMGSGGRVQVDLTTGKRVEVDAGHLTVLRSAGGGTPERAPQSAPAEPEDDPERVVPTAPPGQGQADPPPAADGQPATPEQVAALLNDGFTGSKYEQDEQAHREAVERVVARIDQVPDDLLLTKRTRDRMADPDTRFVQDPETGMWRPYFLDPDTGEDLYADTPGRRTAGADDPEVQESMRQGAVSSILSSWAAGSGKGLSGAVQQMAVREFGIPEPEDVGQTLSQRDQDDIDRIVDETGEGIRAVLRAMHAETQAQFKAAGITHVQVHRGFQWRSTDEGNPRPGWADKTDTEVPLRALSSFSLDREVAERFAVRYAGSNGEVTGEVITGSVPVDRILSIPRTGLGRNAEQEVVVLGGQPLRFQVGEQPDLADVGPEADALAPEAGADVAATIPSAVAAPDATPVGTFAYFDDGTSSAWFDYDDGTEGVGFLRTNRDDPSTTLRIDDPNVWSEEVDRRGLPEQPVPDVDTAAPETVGDEPPAAASWDITTGPDDRAASPDQLQTFLRGGLSEFGSYGQEHSGGFDQARHTASTEARREVVADIGRRLQYLDDRTLLGEDEAGKVQRLTSGTHVLARMPRRNFAGEVMADSWSYREVPTEQWNALTAIPDEVEVVDPDGYREQARAAAVGNMVESWARSSNDANAMSLALQSTAADLFGVEDGMQWPLLDPSYEWFDAGLADEVETMRNERGEAMEAFLAAQYDATQERFAAAGITHVTVYRGHGVTRSDLGRGGWLDDTFTDYTPDGVDIAVPMRPASSFTADADIALAFSGQRDPTRVENLVLSATVPVERILGTSRSGWGSQQEAEIVVLGGTDTWRVQRAADFDPAGMPGSPPAPGQAATPTEPEEDVINPATVPVSMLTDHDELQTAVAAAGDDLERRAALMRRAETLGMSWTIPASWRDDASGGDPKTYDPLGTDTLTEEDYDAAAARPVDSLSTAKDYAAAVMAEWMAAPSDADQERRRALYERQDEFTVVGMQRLPEDWAA